FRRRFPSSDRRCVHCSEAGVTARKSQGAVSMRKLLALTLVAAAACGGGSFQDQARSAMPDSAGVKMGPQQAQQQQMAGPTQQNATQLSGWYLVTVAYSVAINAGTAWTLGVVEAVVDSEPTSCTQDSCVWGPGSNALDPNT